MPDPKTIIHLIETGQYDEAKEQVQELREGLLDMREQNNDLRESLSSAQKEVAELKDKLALEDDLVWDEPFYYKKDDEDREEPFCPKCKTKDGILSRILRRPGDTAYVDCSVCEKYFIVEEHVIGAVAFQRDDPHTSSRSKSLW